MTAAKTDRPALSPPAEGEVSREQWLWAAKIVRELGPSMSPGAMAATMERLAEKAPTPAPVDWNVVGPKLVEALRTARDYVSDAQAGHSLTREDACRLIKGEAVSVRLISMADNDLAAIDAALAAAQPEGK